MSADVGGAYLSLRSLAEVSDLSVRTLRGYLTDPVNPLPHFRTAGKILVKRTDFDEWIRRFKVNRLPTLNAVVDDVMRGYARWPFSSGFGVARGGLT